MHQIESWIEEKRSAYLYRVVAAREAGTPRHALFNELAQEAERQADIWDRQVREAGAAVPAFIFGHAGPSMGIASQAGLFFHQVNH